MRSLLCPRVLCSLQCQPGAVTVTVSHQLELLLTAHAQRALVWRGGSAPSNHLVLLKASSENTESGL